MRDNAIAGGLFGVSEAAEQLGVHTNTVRRWSSRGLLKAYRIGPRGDRRFRQADIDAFLASMGEPRKNGGEQRRVLIVDDDSRVQQDLSNIVQRCGCEAVVATDVDEAIDELSRGSFDLVFVDPVLGDVNGDVNGDGIEVLRAIEETSGDAVVAVIVSYGDAPVALEAMSLGPMFFVHKPLETRHVAKILDTVERVHV